MVQKTQRELSHFSQVPSKPETLGRVDDAFRADYSEEYDHWTLVDANHKMKPRTDHKNKIRVHDDKHNNKLDKTVGIPHSVYDSLHEICQEVHCQPLLKYPRRIPSRFPCGTSC